MECLYVSLNRLQPAANHYSIPDILGSIYGFRAWHAFTSMIIGYFYQSPNDAIAG